MGTRLYIKFKKCALGLLVLFLSSISWAAGEDEGIQSLLMIQNTIESYMLNQLAGTTEGKVSVSAAKIDSRLKLKACAEDKLEVFNPYQSSLLNTNTMGIRCVQDSNHWKLFVPINVEVLKTVLLSKQALKRGTALNEDNFYPAEMNAQKLKQGFFTNPKELLGLVCKKDIPPDTPLNPYNVELAKVVLKGQEVSISASRGSLSVNMKGTALSDGCIGDVIKVKNTSSKKIIEAQVLGDQKVKVTL